MQLRLSMRKKIQKLGSLNLSKYCYRAPSRQFPSDPVRNFRRRHRFPDSFLPLNNPPDWMASNIPKHKTLLLVIIINRKFATI